MVQKMWAFLHSSNPVTWFGHAAMMVGLYYLFGKDWHAPVAAFGYREVSDLAGFAFNGEPNSRAAWTEKLKDGAGDFILALVIATLAVAMGAALGLLGIVGALGIGAVGALALSRAGP